MLADRGYDPVYGARPLKRLLQTSVADPLAKGLLEGTFSDGDTIKADVDGDELSFSN
jgi:ATP-dependent Clp protease ATP-binding subunit ClpB